MICLSRLFPSSLHLVNTRIFRAGYWTPTVVSKVFASRPSMTKSSDVPEREDLQITQNDSDLAAALAALAIKKREVQDLEARIELLRSQSTGEVAEKADPKAPRRGKPYRRGKQEKGGIFAPDCFEEILWNPQEIMPALGRRPIGHIRTCFPRKNGCPRQGSVVPASQAKLDLQFGSNPHHATEGLEDFSHVWLLFLFHDNGTSYCPRPYVNPPRLNGTRKGVFATRSPHRPNPIGLSLCRLDEVRGRTLLLSGIDLVDGTPILDIKPYLPPYDLPSGVSADGSRDLASEWLVAQAGPNAIRYPSWALPSEDSTLTVTVSEAAEAQLRSLEAQGHTPRVIGGWDGVRQALQQVLQADPRSVYRKEDPAVAAQEFSFYLDCLDVRCHFSPAAAPAAGMDAKPRRAVEVTAVYLASLDAQRASVKAGGCAGDRGEAADAALPSVSDCAAQLGAMAVGDVGAAASP